MNMNILGKGVVGLAILGGLSLALSSGFSNAGDGTIAAPAITMSQPANFANVPGAGAVEAVNYSAAGEGTFLANGDLVGGGK
jgi:hypothetical protein